MVMQIAIMRDVAPIARLGFRDDRRFHKNNQGKNKQRVTTSEG